MVAPEVWGGISVAAVLLLLLWITYKTWPEEEEDVDAGQSAARPAALHAHPHPPEPVVAAPTVTTTELGVSADVKGDAMGASVVCAICLDVPVKGAARSEVPAACQHLFHRDCIELWMKRNNTCALCKDPLVPGSQKQSAAEDMV